MARTRGQVDFDRLVNSEEFARFSKLIEDFTGLCVAFHAPGSARIQPLTGLDRLNPVCNLIEAKAEGLRRCRATTRANSKRAAEAGSAMHYPCHAGLYDVTVPIFSEGEWIGSLQSGQLLPSPPSEEGYQEFMLRNADLGLDPGAVREAYFKSPYLAKEKVETFMGLLSLFAGYVCEMGRRIHDLTEAKQADEIERAKQYIQDHFREAISLKDVAEHAGFYPTWLSMRFKEVAGMTFVTYLQQVRLEEAKKLLAQTDEPITTIALASGFNSLSQFHRVFRRFEKCTPGQFRRQNRDKHSSR